MSTSQDTRRAAPSGGRHAQATQWYEPYEAYDPRLYGANRYAAGAYGPDPYGARLYEPYGTQEYGADLHAGASYAADAYPAARRDVFDGLGPDGGSTYGGAGESAHGWRSYDAYAPYGAGAFGGHGPGAPTALQPAPAQPAAPYAPEGYPRVPRQAQPYPPAAPVPPRLGGRSGGRRAVRRRRRAAERPETLRRLVPQALVVAFLAGGSTAFIADDKSVTLSVDGVPRTLHTFADDVGELLAEEHVEYGAHDIVAPAPDQPLAAGDRIAVRYGRLITLTLDGVRRRVWTTARTVEGALHQLGVRAEGAYLSTSRHASISRRGLTLDVRTERTVSIMADGRERRVRTNAATVREAVEQAGIVLRGEDTTSVPLDSFPRDGQTISVLRITGTREVREELIDYATIKRGDPTLFQGTEVVVQQGQHGLKRVTYAMRTVNGVRQKPRKLRSDVVRQPVPQVVRVGTRPLPSSVAGADGLDWGALAQCESGGRPDAVDPSGSYGGLYQFDVHTWHDLGGRGRPEEASAAEQTYRAKKLYVQRGASPWPVCGRKLHQ